VKGLNLSMMHGSPGQDVFLVLLPQTDAYYEPGLLDAPTAPV